MSAAELGLTPEYVKKHEQKLANSLLFDLYEQNYAYVNEEMPPLDSLFMIQSKVIRDVSEKESCVIVGRCADFVLKSHSNCFNVCLFMPIKSIGFNGLSTIMVLVPVWQKKNWNGKIVKEQIIAGIILIKYGKSEQLQPDN